MNLFANTLEEIQQEEFISILHHDANKRGGMFTGVSIRKNVNGNTEMIEKWTSKNAYSLMTVDTSYNRYIALNSFHSIKEDEKVTVRRKESHLHAITAVYLDLDCHDETQEQDIQECVSNTKKLLEHTYEENILPRPTMITETGRGLGLFYVLDRSIANAEKTGKQIRFWKYICKEYAKKYQSILDRSDQKQLEIDFKVVGDVSRVVRLPGTKNLNTGTFCRLSVNNKADGTPVYFSLQDLIKYVETYKAYESSCDEIRKNILKSKIVNFNAYNNPFLYQRIEKLKRAQTLVIDQTEGSRELLCFIYYNTAKQLMTENAAFVAMLEFNRKFKNPITDMKELQNIAKTVENATDMDRIQKGYYKYKDITLKELLNITDEENEYVGFGISNKEILRKQKKEENKKKKKQRNKSIIDYVIEHPDVTYESIANMFNVSLRTIKNILKEAGVNRYEKKGNTSACNAENSKNKNKREQNVDALPLSSQIDQTKKTKNKKLRKIEKKRNIIKWKKKVQKFATVSNCCVSVNRECVSKCVSSELYLKDDAPPDESG